MASHFLLYASVDSQTAYACDDDPDTARSFADREQEAGRARMAFVVRMLTGTCGICGKSVSKLSGVRDPLPLGYDA